MTRALILGVNGQDGSYLAELLLAKGYDVVGWIPSTIPVTLENIQHILSRIMLIKGNLLDQGSLNASIDEYRPDEIYNFAAPSSPSDSWNATVQVGDIAGLGVARLLEAVRLVAPRAHFYQASSSELFGDPIEVPQKETTPFHPRNPYGVAKLYAHWSTVNYRKKYGLFAVSGILYNHESPRRGLDFVSRKITLEAARIKQGLSKELSLGNLDAQRDWGFAGDYVEAIWRMLHRDNPEDFVIGTGEVHSVSDFLDEAFSYIALDWHEYVRIDPDFLRPEEGGTLQSDPRKARQVLGWEPHVSFRELVRMMVDADLELISLESLHQVRKPRSSGNTTEANINGIVRL